jgi:hypothetical protein
MIVVVQTEKFARSMLHRNVIKNTNPRPIHLVFVGGIADEDEPIVLSKAVFMPAALCVLIRGLPRVALCSIVHSSARHRTVTMFNARHVLFLPSSPSVLGVGSTFPTRARLWLRLARE